MKPYYADELVTLYHGDSVELLPALGVKGDCIVADPPYGETSLAWDKWPDGWLDVAATVARSLWCFGSLRMFLAHADEFSTWKLSQDVIWEKHNGSGFAADRFKRVHESVTHWYQGAWGDAYRAVPTEVVGRTDRGGHVRSIKRPAHTGDIGQRLDYDGNSRLMRSVLKVRSMQGGAIHPTEKPVGILTPLIEYACPPDGLVVDPFAGSGSTLEAARISGRRAIGIEANEKYCEAAARRFSQGVLEMTP
ncbi:MAG TPA: site-specific DNA-methyltransferase [Amycolatopsis sp.]|jgi:site-specific DNA-methyltransferase (adenine-specific)